MKTLDRGSAVASPHLEAVHQWWGDATRSLKSLRLGRLLKDPAARPPRVEESHELSRVHRRTELRGLLLQPVTDQLGPAPAMLAQAFPAEMHSLASGIPQIAGERVRVRARQHALLMPE